MSLIIATIAYHAFLIPSPGSPGAAFPNPRRTIPSRTRSCMPGALEPAGKRAAAVSAAWSLNDLPWERLAAHRVDRELLETVKTAALVEANSADYVTYLHNVFADDAEFTQAASGWGREEAQHGAALGRWAELVDPSFKFADSLAHFRRGYRIPVTAVRSVRGSRSGELVARCVVESGTCSFYSALRDRSSEPVLRAICHHIAQDEARHYRLFLLHLGHYLQREPLALLERLRIALGRVTETGDDELAYAYYSANVACAAGNVARYDRARYARAYWRRALQLYDLRHLRGAVHMILNAVDLDPASRWARVAAQLIWRSVQWRARRLRRDPGS